MKRRIIIASISMLAVSAAPTVAHADPSTDANSVSFQLGLMPSFSVVGIEYVRVLHPRFDLAASASVGYGMQVSLIPRVRHVTGAWRFTAGVGPSLSLLSFDDESVRYPQLVAEGAVAYLTKGGRELQVKVGYTAFCDGDGGVFDCSTVDGQPVAALGIGWTF